MKKIVMFYGSDRAFAEIIPKGHRNLLSVAMQIDDESKKFVMEIKGLPKQDTETEKPKKKKPRISNLVIYANEYNSVNEHVITNFVDFYGTNQCDQYVYSKSTGIVKRSGREDIRRKGHNQGR